MPTQGDKLRDELHIIEYVVLIEWEYSMRDLHARVKHAERQVNDVYSELVTKHGISKVEEMRGTRNEIVYKQDVDRLYVRSSKVLRCDPSVKVVKEGDPVGG